MCPNVLTFYPPSGAMYLALPAQRGPTKSQLSPKEQCHGPDPFMTPICPHCSDQTQQRIASYIGKDFWEMSPIFLLKTSVLSRCAWWSRNLGKNICFSLKKEVCLNLICSWERSSVIFVGDALLKCAGKPVWFAPRDKNVHYSWGLSSHISFLPGPVTEACSAEKESDRAAWMSVWHPVRVNTLQHATVMLQIQPALSKICDKHHCKAIPLISVRVFSKKRKKIKIQKWMRISTD